MPDKPIKHVTRKQSPVGAVKRGKLKVEDGATGKKFWRQGTKGFARDWDGEPIATNYNREGLKTKPTHSVHMGRKKASTTE